MSRRRSDSRSLYELAILIITIIGVVTKFLIEVNKRGLWKECGISTGAVFLLNYILYQLGAYEILPFEVFGWSCLISFIAYCVYWSGLFNNNPYNQFSKGSLKRNSSHWPEQAWWWSLDGWQFEQEVAKLYILQGYRATVTRGSGDGGVDIIIESEGYRGIIQCKHYRNPVPPEPIRALWGCKDDFGADEVILIASSGITQAGADFISNKPDFRVLNLDDVIRMSRQTSYIPGSGSMYEPVPEPEPEHESVIEAEPVSEPEPAPAQEPEPEPKKISHSPSYGRKIDM